MSGPSGVAGVYRLLAILALLFLAGQATAIYVEDLWHRSVGSAPVYWYRLFMSWSVFAVAAAASTLALGFLLQRIIPRAPDLRTVVEFGMESIVIPSARQLRTGAWLAAAGLGLLFGASFRAEWLRFALYLNGPPTRGLADPVLGRELSFYFFTLPVLDALSGWLLAVSMIVLLGAAAATLLDRSGRFQGLSLGLGLALAAAAGQAWLHRYHRLYESGPLFSGVAYVDDRALLPALWVLAAVLLAGAAICFYNVRAGRPRLLLLALAGPLLVYLGAGVLIPAYVTHFVVRPNQLAMERPYIRHNIDATRRAFGLDAVEEIPFDPTADDRVLDSDIHRETLENVRLWDWRALQAALEQIQEIRTYYDFIDVDVDRYIVDGRKRSMMLATREINLARLPSGSNNWINERLIFTHGYGVTMNPVNGFSTEGMPELVLSDMPVRGAIPSIQVRRPEIYFGELTDWPVYVRTRQQEFNYPEGDRNNYSSYEADAGIAIGSMFRRLLLAYATGDLMTLPFAADVTPESRLLMRRNIRERVQHIAPFLVYDDDAYIVVGEDGGLYWMMDAFTTSSRHPYSTPVLFRQQPVNYIRNSVKVVINAYDGATRFYVYEPDDPLIQAYRNMFPDLFADAAEMPEMLRRHVRYPDLLFQIQALVYTTYHVEDEQVFFNREDLWTVARQGRSQAGSDPMEPYFVLLRFPGEEELEFVTILPFTPANRNNLIGWLAARSDGAAYGGLRAYAFPKTSFVDGPLQIEARIDQDPELSSQLSLWNQQGSTVLRGNLLVIPLDETLLFVAPIFLQAERSPMPELRIVVLATRNRMAYGATFDEALARLLDRPAAADLTTGPDPLRPPPASSASLQALIEQAGQALADYQRLTAQGRLADAGQRLEQLRETLAALQAGGREAGAAP